MVRKVRNIMKYRKIALVCLILSIFLNFSAFLLSNIEKASLTTTFLRMTSTGMLVVGIILLLTFITISLTLWKCPCCKNRLPIKFDKENNDIDDIYVCPYCHTRFLDGEILE